MSADNETKSIRKRTTVWPKVFVVLLICREINAVKNKKKDKKTNGFTRGIALEFARLRECRTISENSTSVDSQTSRRRRAAATAYCVYRISVHENGGFSAKVRWRVQCRRGRFVRDPIIPRACCRLPPEWFSRSSTDGYNQTSRMSPLSTTLRVKSIIRYLFSFGNQNQRPKISYDKT